MYCNETICPEWGTMVPLSPNWVISSNYKVVAKLKYNKQNNNFDINI